MITPVQSGSQRFSLDHDGAGWHRKGPKTRSCAPWNQTHVELFGLVRTKGSGRQTMKIRPTIITKWRGGGGGAVGGGGLIPAHSHLSPQQVHSQLPHLSTHKLFF